MKKTIKKYFEKHIIMGASKFFRDLTAEETAKLKSDRLEAKSKLTLAYQLGFYVGEQIVDKYLPTLSSDLLQTRKVISVTAAEDEEVKRLTDVWLTKTHEVRFILNQKSIEKQDGKKSWEIDNEVQEATEKEWEELLAYRKMLEDKYLPKTVECYFQLLNVPEENMEEFKKGVGVALWDCDCSHYECEPEKISVIEDEDGWYTTIVLVKG